MNETIIDETISKRPIRRPMDRSEEYNKLIHLQENTEAVIAELDAKIQAKESNESYRIVLQDTKARLLEIAINAISIPPSDALRHAEALGNYKERILLTRELLNLKMSEKKQRGIIEIITRKLSEWTT